MKGTIYAVSYGAGGNLAFVHSIWSSARMTSWQARQLNNGQEGPWASVGWEVRDAGSRPHTDKSAFDIPVADVDD